MKMPCAIALVSPYSWTYPGGVTRHIEALAERFIEDGHDVRVLAPFDPPGRFAAARTAARGRSALDAARLSRLARAHGRLQGERRGLEPLDHARTASRRCTASCGPAATTWSTSTSRSRRSTGWVATDWTRLPLVGTFHSYSENRVCRTAIAQPDRRAADAQPPARPDRRLGGGRVDRRAASSAATTA